MANGKKGFRGIVLAPVEDTTSKIEDLREDLNKDFKKRLKKIEKKDKDSAEAQNNAIRAFSAYEAWSHLQQVRQNIINRLAVLGQLAETSGPNAGKIVIPTTWNDKAQMQVARLFDAVLGIEVDINNGFSALQAMDLWTILAGQIGGSNQMNESLFSSLLIFRFLGSGLQAGLMFPALPGAPALASTLLLPRLVGTQIGFIVT